MSKKNEQEITRQESVFIAGGTGSGKSALTEIYLAGSNFPHVVKIDTKGEYYERKTLGIPAWKGLEEGKDYQVVFKLNYERQNTTVWIDELMSICDNPHRIPRMLKAVYTRGRSRNTTCWACSQRASEIPNIILSNTQVFFIFQMNLESDRKKLVMMTDQKEFMIKPQKYYFWFYKIGNNKPVLATLKMR